MIRNNELITQKKFNKISIGLASPEVVLANSRGEVLKPETINYRTHLISYHNFNYSLIAIINM